MIFMCVVAGRVAAAERSRQGAGRLADPRDAHEDGGGRFGYEVRSRSRRSAHIHVS